MRNADSEVFITQHETIERKEFAFYIKTMRKSLGLTHEQLAELFETSIANVKKYEKGDKIPYDPYLVIYSLREYIRGNKCHID